MESPTTSESASDGEKALCDICSTALRTSTIDTWDRRLLTIKLHTSFRAFVEAVAQGCLVCHHLIRRLGHEGERLFWKIAHALDKVVGLPTARKLTRMHVRLDLEPGRLECRTELRWSSYFRGDLQLPVKLRKDIRAMLDLEIQAQGRYGVDFTWRLSRLQGSSVSGAKGRSKTSHLATP
jgi:hypothetical protein